MLSLATSQMCGGITYDTTSVMCGDGFVLVTKSSTSEVSCVTSKTADALVARGWGTIAEEITPIQITQDQYSTPNTAVPKVTTYENFDASNAVLLLLDHQVGTITWMHSAAKEKVKRNTLALAKGAKAVGMPIILTSSLEENFQGPLFPELQEILPEEFASRIKRSGIVNAFDDENFRAAVEQTGRKKLIMAGLLTEVCVIYPALTALAEGYEVQVIADASGSATEENDRYALDRIRQEGGSVTYTIQILSEMVKDWTVDPGPAMIPVLGDLTIAIDAESKTE